MENMFGYNYLMNVLNDRPQDIQDLRGCFNGITPDEVHEDKFWHI